METVKAYIAQYPEDIQQRCLEIQALVLECAPHAKEVISWGMPTYKLQHNIFHFAVCKGYIGIYPGGDTVSAFKDKLEDFKTTKGSIHLPNNKELPFALLREILIYNIEHIG